MSADTAAKEALLEVSGLNVWLPTPRGPFHVVKDVTCSVHEGRVLAVAGESGSGKTMLAKTVAGLLPSEAGVSGRLRFRGENMLGDDGRVSPRYLGTQIGVIPQDPLGSLHPMLTIGRQLCEHMEFHLGIDRRDARARAVSLLDELRLPDAAGMLRRYPHQLSGGMRQRVALAVALACNPSLLIADEPTTALDVTIQAALLNLITSVATTRSMGVVFITHDLAVLAAIADQMVVMQAGSVVESGTTRAVLTETRHDYTKQLVDALRRRDEP